MKTKHASALPLQDMIRGVLDQATEKLAADPAGTSEKVRKLVSQESDDADEGSEKTAAAMLTSPGYLEKLASAVEYIASNLDNIETQQPGIIASALAKMAQDGSPQGAGKGPGALEVSKAIGGTQKYTKDKPAGEDPSASSANKPLSSGGLPGGKTQLQNTMHNAPGGGGIKPTAKYPAEGPLRAEKKASVIDRYKAVIEKTASEMTGQRITVPAAGKVKTAGQIAKDAILQKLAGEDVLKANISSPRDGGPLPGDGGLKVMKSGENAGSESGGPTGSDGNQGRRHIGSNSAAINFTKKDAKGPQKTQLAEVLDEPALSAAHDSKLRENLRNAGKAGVKIAAVQSLQKIASEGCKCASAGRCQYCQLQVKVAAIRSGSVKRANAAGMSGGAGMPPSPGGASGGMASMAAMGAGPDGCQCGNTGECRVCKLKALMAAAAAGGSPQGMPASVEKDSMGAGPAMGGLY